MILKELTGVGLSLICLKSTYFGAFQTFSGGNAPNLHSR